MSFPKTFGLQLIFWQAHWLGEREGERCPWNSDEGEGKEEEGGTFIQRGSAAGHAWRGEEDPEADHAPTEALHEAVPRAGLFLLLSFCFYSSLRLSRMRLYLLSTRRRAGSLPATSSGPWRGTPAMSTCRFSQCSCWLYSWFQFVSFADSEIRLVWTLSIGYILILKYDLIEFCSLVQTSGRV